MAAAQGVDQQRGVIFQSIKQSFDIDKLNRYVGALLQVAYLPADKRPDALHIEGRLVGFGDIEDELKRFAEQFNETLPDELRIPLDPFDIFSTRILSRLIVAFEGVDAYDPEIAKSNMPKDLHEKIEEMRRYKEAQLELGKKREDALSSMDRQIKASLERYRYAQQLKLVAQAQLERMFLDSSYLKNLQDLEVALGGRGNLEQYVKEQIAALVERNISVISIRQLDKLIADNPGLAAAYFKRLILQDIQQHDLFRTAYFTAHPKKKKEALEAIEEEAKGAFEKAQPHVQVIEQEREALRAEGIDPDELNALSYTHRPMAEIRRWTQTALKISTSERFIETLLIQEAGRFGIRLNAPEVHRWVGRLRQMADPGARLNFLKGRLEGLKPSQLNTLFQIISPQLNALAAFTPETIREAAQWRPDLLPQSVVTALTSPTSSLSLPKHQRVIQEVAEKTGVSVDHVEAYAAGLNRQTLDTHVAQAKLGVPAQSWFKDFQEKSLPKLEQWFGPKGAIPKAPAAPGAPQTPIVSEEISGNFRQLSGANVFRARVGQTLRFLRVDRAVNFVARSAPVRAVSSFIAKPMRAVTNVVTSPFRAVGNAVTSGVTGVKNWAKSQIIAGATSVGKNLVTWGAKQAVKAGVMGFAGKAATWAGTNLLAVAGGTALKSIPFIGQAIGAAQEVGGAIFGFVGTTIGSTFDFLRGRKSFGQWVGAIGEAGLKSSGTLIGAAVGGLIGAAVGAGIGLLFAGVGALPGLIIGLLTGIMIGGMIGGALTGGLAKFAKDPAEMLKMMFGLLLMGGFALAGLLAWAAGHVLPLIGAAIGFSAGFLFGPLFPIMSPLLAYAGWKAGEFLASGKLPAAFSQIGSWIKGAWSGVKTLASDLWTGAGQFVGNVFSGVGSFVGNLFSTGQIALGNFIGWIGQAGWTLGGSVLGGIGGFFMGGAPGALLGGGLGAVGGSWLGSGGLNSLLSGIGPAMTNSVVAATNFLGSLTSTTAATSIVSTTTTVVLGGVAAAGGITMLFVIPSILSALYVPGGGGVGRFNVPPGCPAQIWPVDLSRGQTFAVTQGPGGWATHGPNLPTQPLNCGTASNPEACPIVEAVDIAPGASTPEDVTSDDVVIATHPGIVERAQADGYGGLYVWVNENCNDTMDFVTVYVHMDALSVSPGQTITAGTILGPMGDTGRAGGNPHVHYEFRRQGLVYINRDAGDGPPFMIQPFVPVDVPRGCVGRAGTGGCNISIP